MQLTNRSRMCVAGALVAMAAMATTAAQAATITLTPVAEFAVRAGSTLNPTGSTEVFGGSNDDEAFLEFDIGSLGPVSSARLKFNIFDLAFFPVTAGDPLQFKLATYAANGAADVSDFGSGTPLVFLDSQVGVETQFSVDVTSFLTALQTGGESFAGFRFYDPLDVNASLADQVALIETSLDVTVVMDSPVPEPATLSLLGLGLGLAAFGWRRGRT